jgi:ABC-type uncharacterized transport system ATPase subunit
MTSDTQSIKIIEIRDGMKEFNGIVANKNISFSLNKGEVHSLLGENGAGKSTMTKVMSGVYKLTEGQLYVDGEPIIFTTPSEALKK